MPTSTEFRCYYDDGTILVAPYCPLTNDNGSPLISSDYHIIDDVVQTTSFPWWILILLLVWSASDKKKG